MNVSFITLTSFPVNGLCWTQSSYSNSQLTCFIMVFFGMADSHGAALRLRFLPSNHLLHL